jgi:hypothetical protein
MLLVDRGERYRQILPSYVSNVMQATAAFGRLVGRLPISG